MVDYYFKTIKKMTTAKKSTCIAKQKMENDKCFLYTEF